MHLQGPDADPFLQTTATAPQQGATAGRQLFQPEGFAQHVVSAGIEQSHHRFRAGTSREHHHRTVQLAGQAQG